LLHSAGGGVTSVWGFSLEGGNLQEKCLQGLSPGIVAIIRLKKYSSVSNRPDLCDEKTSASNINYLPTRARVRRRVDQTLQLVIATIARRRWSVAPLFNSLTLANWPTSAAAVAARQLLQQNATTAPGCTDGRTCFTA